MSCRELLDPSFLFAVDNGDKFVLQPIRFDGMFKMRRVKVKLLIFIEFKLSIFFFYNLETPFSIYFF